MRGPEQVAGHTVAAAERLLSKRRLFLTFNPFSHPRPFHLFRLVMTRRPTTTLNTTHFANRCPTSQRGEPVPNSLPKPRCRSGDQALPEVRPCS